MSDASWTSRRSALLASRSSGPALLVLRQEGSRWTIEADLLQVLVDRLGPVDELVRPLSEQGPSAR